jgi:23S rRNA G2069 N7-methylase RlmK/C1962 C5-methylase RlmI
MVLVPENYENQSSENPNTYFDSYDVFPINPPPARRGQAEAYPVPSDHEHMMRKCDRALRDTYSVVLYACGMRVACKYFATPILGSIGDNSWCSALSFLSF